MDTVQRKTMGFVLQDVQCIKCSEVKLSNMGKRCTCAGKSCSPGCIIIYCTLHLIYQNNLQFLTIPICFNLQSCCICFSCKEQIYIWVFHFSGNYRTLTSSADLEQLLTTFLSIAKYYKMPLLQEMAQWYLTMNSAMPKWFFLTSERNVYIYLRKVLNVLLARS